MKIAIPRILLIEHKEIFLPAGLVVASSRSHDDLQETGPLWLDHHGDLRQHWTFPNDYRNNLALRGLSRSKQAGAFYPRPEILSDEKYPERRGEGIAKVFDEISPKGLHHNDDFNYSIAT